MAPATLEVCATHEKAIARTPALARDSLSGHPLFNGNMPALDRSELVIHLANHYVECERIRFEEVAAGNNQFFPLEVVSRERKKRTETNCNASTIRYTPKRWLRVPSRKLPRLPKPLPPGCIRCHCLSATCGPNNRMSQRSGCKSKLAGAVTHRIEEVVAALYWCKPNASRTRCRGYHTPEDIETRVPRN